MKPLYIIENNLMNPNSRGGVTIKKVEPCDADPVRANHGDSTASHDCFEKEVL